MIAIIICNNHDSVEPEPASVRAQCQGSARADGIAVFVLKNLDTLELQIQNTSRKPIKYMLVHAQLAGTSLRVPLTFGQAPGSKTGAAELLQPGAQISLKPAKAVCDRTSLSRSSLDRLVAAGGFPKPIRITERRLAYNLADVEAWMMEKVAA